MGERVGIRDVARAAQLSTATVSHALNNKGRVAAATREKVLRIAEEIGYTANQPARHLSGGRTGLLGIRVAECPDFPQIPTDFEYFSALMSGASLEALSRGYSIALLPQSQHTEQLSAVPLDGVIVVDPTKGDPLLRRLKENNIPVVSTGRDIEAARDQGYWVDNDHVAGTPRALDHLSRQGAKNIALITTPPVHSYTYDICCAYEDWMRKRDLEPRISVVDSNPTEEGGFRAASFLLSDSPPDAIHATFDRLAIGALLAAVAVGLRVPDDILVSGSTDSHAMRAAKPALTTVSFEPEQVGRAAVGMLIQLVEGRAVENQHPVIPTRLICRGSTLRRTRGLPRH